MTNVCSTVTLLLLTVEKPCQISGRPACSVNNLDEMGQPWGGSAAE